MREGGREAARQKKKRIPKKIKTKKSAWPARCTQLKAQKRGTSGGVCATSGRYLCTRPLNSHSRNAGCKAPIQKAMLSSSTSRAIVLAPCMIAHKNAEKNEGDARAAKRARDRETDRQRGEAKPHRERGVAQSILPATRYIHRAAMRRIRLHTVKYKHKSGGTKHKTSSETRGSSWKASLSPHVEAAHAHELWLGPSRGRPCRMEIHRLECDQGATENGKNVNYITSYSSRNGSDGVPVLLLVRCTLNCQQLLLLLVVKLADCAGTHLCINRRGSPRW